MGIGQVLLVKCMPHSVAVNLTVFSHSMSHLCCVLLILFACLWRDMIWSRQGLCIKTIPSMELTVPQDGTAGLVPLLEC